MKWSFVLISVLLTMLFVTSSTPLAQTREDAVRIQEEAAGARSVNDLLNAVQKYERALEIYEQLGDQENAGKLLDELGILSKNVGQYEKALQFHERALRMQLRMGDQLGEGQTLKNLGNLYNAWKQPDKAMDFYEKALAIAWKIGDLTTEAQVLNNLGAVYQEKGQQDKAIEFYEESLQVTRRIGDVKTEGITVSNLGIVYKDQAHYDKALENYERLIEIKRQLGDKHEEGRILNEMAGLYARQGEYAKAIGLFENALTVKKELNDRPGQGEILNSMGRVLVRQGEYSKAIEIYQQALNIGTDLKDRAAVGTTLYNIAWVHQCKGEYDKALDLYTNVLPIKRELEDPAGELQLLNDIGILYSNWGQYEKAVEYYQKSLKMAKKLGTPEGEIDPLNNMGNVQRESGQYQKAVEYYEKALEIARKLGDPQREINPLNNLGNVYKDWGQYQKAVEYYQKSLEIAKKLGSPQGEINPLNNLGNVYKDWGQYQKAVQYYEKSLEIARKLGNLNSQATTFNNLGVVYQAWGAYGDALASFEKGLAFFQRIGVPTGLATFNIGNLYLDTGQVEKAEPFVKEANYYASLGRLALAKADFGEALNQYKALLNVSLSSRNISDLFTAYTGLGTALEAAGRNQDAARHYRKAVDLTEELRSGLNGDERETFLDVKVNGFYRTEPYEGLARVLLKMNKPLEALRQSEYTKARTFAEAISKRSGYSGLDVSQEISDRDSALSERLSAAIKSLQNAYEKGNKDAIDTLEPQVKEAKENLTSHIEMLREKYPLFAATKYPQPMDLSQTSLRDGEWVISYDVTDSGLIVYLTEGKQLRKALLKPVSRKQLEELVRKLRIPFENVDDDNVHERLKDFDFASGKKLADILLADVLSDLPKDLPVMIVPADCLGILPFEMLPLSDDGKMVDNNEITNASGADFFGDRNPISYYQSITALTISRNFAKQAAFGTRTLVMCDPVFSDDDPRLIANRKHQQVSGLHQFTRDVLMSTMTQNGQIWKRVALTKQLGEFLKNLNPSTTDVYDGLEANKVTFKRQKLREYQAIVFATHGYAGTDLGGLKEPVLVLTLVNQPPGETGFLRMSEVTGLEMNADIVALTACQTGLGRRISGEGTVGMGRAFQYAGAKSVLMSLWSVEQRASIQLAEAFFKHMREGKSKLEALKLARDEIRKLGFDHPFFWAPFILVGEVN